MSERLEIDFSPSGDDSVQMALKAEFNELVSKHADNLRRELHPGEIITTVGLCLPDGVGLPVVSLFFIGNFSIKTLAKIIGASGAPPEYIKSVVEQFRKAAGR